MTFRQNTTNKKAIHDSLAINLLRFGKEKSCFVINSLDLEQRVEAQASLRITGEKKNC